MTSTTDLSRRASLKAGVSLTLMPLAPAASSAAADVRTAGLVPDRRDQSFDGGWRFLLGDDASYARPGFPDGGWRSLDLPHDWSIEDRVPTDAKDNAVLRTVDTAPLWQPPGEVAAAGPFDPGASSGGPATGYTVGGIGWYRKRFRIDALPADARVEVAFDGAYMLAEVWLNGEKVGSHVHGYTAFHIDLTPRLRRDGENVIAVRVANTGKNSRWYSGSGLYRRVRLNVTRSIRFETWSVSVRTPVVSRSAATIDISARVQEAGTGTSIRVEIQEPSGKVVAHGEAPALTATKIRLEMADPKLWSPSSPVLYRAVSTLRRGEDVLDRVETTFGVRSIEADARRGLLINGVATKLRGGCVHHDNGLLGAVAIERADERRIELLKARGFNAIRSSHNPASSSLLDACDRLGMFVVDEPFDMWDLAKNPDDYHLYFKDNWRSDLSAMVERDGNHPSVIMWSIGNEIPNGPKPEGAAVARMLADALREMDSSRPITQAIHGGNGADVTTSSGKVDQIATQALDVAGYNYRYRQYERDHARFPDRVFLGTETYPIDTAAVWRIVDANPYVIGDFVWTAMDYIGEAGIGRPMLGSEKLKIAADFPWFNGFCGDVDLIGQQKPQSLHRDVVWGLKTAAMVVARPIPEGEREAITPWGWRDELQSWSWAGHEGKPLKVWVFTSGDRVELFLNGAKVGEQAVAPADGAKTSFEVPYAPGRLSARTYSGSRMVGSCMLETVGKPTAVRLAADRQVLTSKPGELAYVTVEIVDSQGRLIPDAVLPVRIAIAGSASLAAFGNANPRAVASFRQTTTRTWHGRALAILKPTTSNGSILVKVEADGLRPAMIRLKLTRPPAAGGSNNT